LTPPHAYFLSIPAGHHLNSRQLLELVQADTFEEVVQRLPQPLRNMLSAVTTINEVETLLENETERVARNILRHTAFNLARAFAFLVLREKQMHRLHVIVKGRHLRVSPQLIRSTAGIGLLQEDTGPLK
jgi:V/A-type H+-transporting ATPase subunit C